MKKTIKVTKNYEQFSYIKGNRIINTNHLNKIVKSMEGKYVPNPIIVNGNYEILDGQHRFEACKELGLPLYYMMTDGWNLDDVRTANIIVRKWSYADYIYSYKSLEKTDTGPYTILDWFIRKYEIPNECGLQILSNAVGRTALEKFKAGKFEVQNLQKATSFANFLFKIKPYWQSYRKRAFITAIRAMDEDARFNRTTFLERIAKHSMKMRECTNALDYMDVIEYVYNCGSRDKIRFDRGEHWTKGYKPLRH